MSTTSTPITVHAHNATGAFADQVREFLARAEVPADVSLTVNLYSGSAAFEVTKWDTDRCAQCEQPLNRDELPGPVTVFDQSGNRNGEYAFQHGCGGHNVPSEALVWVDADTDLDAALSDILTELERKVQAHLSTLREEWRGRGKRALAAVQAELDAITDPEERAEFLDSHSSPYGDLSVVWEADMWHAEVYAPDLSENPEPEWVFA